MFAYVTQSTYSTATDCLSLSSFEDSQSKYPITVAGPRSVMFSSCAMDVLTVGSVRNNSEFGKAHYESTGDWGGGGKSSNCGLLNGVGENSVEVRGSRTTLSWSSCSPCYSSTMYINNNSPTVMDVDSSRTIVEDYIRYRLESNGLSWQNGQRDVSPNEIQRAMRGLGDEFESRFSQSFDDMINQLHITPETAYQTFSTIVHEIFKDGVNWGRIVALFGFGGKLAVRCVQQSMQQLVCSIVDWVTTYVDTTLKPWIASNSGWAGFLEFYEGGPEGRGSESWPSFKTICGYAAAGLGILTLGAFLSQKS